MSVVGSVLIDSRQGSHRMLQQLVCRWTTAVVKTVNWLKRPVLDEMQQGWLLLKQFDESALFTCRQCWRQLLQHRSTLYLWVWRILGAVGCNSVKQSTAFSIIPRSITRKDNGVCNLSQRKNFRRTPNDEQLVRIHMHTIIGIFWRVVQRKVQDEIKVVLLVK